MADQTTSTSTVCNFVWQSTAVAAIVTTLVVMLVATITTGARQDAIFRMCGTGRASDVDGSGGETGAVTEWSILIDGNADLITYDFRVLATMSAVRAIEIRGPLQLGLHSGPLAAVFCGQASITETIASIPSCNQLSTPGSITGYIERVFNGSSTTGYALRNFWQSIRDNPQLYYGEVMTSTFPTTPGAMRFSLAGSYCGNA
jgi:hypothetical protein